MYEIGKTGNKSDVKESVFLIHPNIKNCVADFKAYSISD